MEVEVCTCDFCGKELVNAEWIKCEVCGRHLERRLSESEVRG